MRIIADENMPFAREAFSHLGTVQTLPGRAIQPADLAGADALMVRSITKVNAALLAGTPVRFVGTATIGTDHVDQTYLAAQGIGFSSAPGCNAESVAQYMAAALVFAALRSGRRLAGSSIGIVGVGNCGRRVARVAQALGLRVVLNDPPLARATGDSRYVPLAKALACDYLALHVPLTREGPDATLNLIGADELAQLKPGAVVINACRGGVLDEAAALVRLEAGHLGGLILDAWAGEPRINPAVAARVLLGTPHIAGYSFDGKVAGTTMIYEAACRWFGQEAHALALPLPPAGVPTLTLDAAGRDVESVLAEAILTAYPIYRDDGDLRRTLPAPETRGEAFDGLRKRYPLRREFAATQLHLRHGSPNLAERFELLGFKVVPE
jgi:erythronate-4-phosphate dehydrogenase